MGILALDCRVFGFVGRDEMIAYLNDRGCKSVGEVFQVLYELILKDDFAGDRRLAPAEAIRALDSLFEESGGNVGKREQALYFEFVELLK